MRLLRLDIRMLPGIHPGFSVDEFAPGVNFITGPNASGKSSTIRALRLLLAGPQPGDPAHVDLAARFELDGSQWQVRRRGRQVEWERDGRPAERPELPAGDALASYLVSVEDLFRLQGGNERRLGERLRRELNEGYDLGALRSDAFPIQPRIGLAEQRELGKRREALRDIDAAQREVEQLRRQLPDLDRRIDQARAAQREVKALETALELHQARHQAEQLDARRAGFPDGMDRLLGNEAERLDELLQQVETLETGLAEQRRVKQQAIDDLADTGLAGKLPDEQALAAQRAAAERLDERERQLEDARAQAADAEIAFDRARQRLQLEDTQADQLPTPDADNLRRAQELAGTLEQHLQRQEELEHELDALDAGAGHTDDDLPDDRVIDRQRRAMHALEDWLATPQTGAVAWIAAGLLAAGGGFAALTGWRDGPDALLYGGGAALGLAVLLPWLGARLIAGRRRRQTAQQLEALRIDGPGEWTRTGVRSRLEQLDAAVDALREALSRQARAAELSEKLARVELDLDRLQRERRELAGQVGFDPRLTTRAMAQFLRDLEVFHNGRLDQARALERVRRLEDESGQLRESIRAFLAPLSDESTTDAARSLTTALERLQQRATRARDADRERQQAEREIERLGRELDQTRGRIDRLYRDAGLEPGQRTELQKRFARLDDWRSVVQQLHAVRQTIAERTRALEDRPDLKAKARGQDAEALRAELDQARERADTLAGLSEQRGEIKSRVDQTGRDHARERALAKVAIASDTLERLRDGVVEAELAHFLLDEIESEHRRHSEPPLLQAAREAFGAFTHHQWDLEFIERDDGLGFQARDRALDERRPLAELSTATRMQLLLALRIAQVRRAEHGGARLPLIVDEALTTSDHQRAAVIMRNLEQLADDGRQVIYLAAGDYEYRLWQHATGTAPNLIDLGALRQLAATDRAPEFELPAAHSVPKPERMRVADYANALGVPAIDPRAPAESVHVLHLLTDRLDLLHRLLESWRTTTLGQLEGLLNASAAETAVPDPAERELLAQRCRITRDWIEAWRIGRGRPLDRGVLDHAVGDGGLTETTLAGVAELAEKVDQDATALIAELEHQPITMASGNQRRIGKPQLQAFAEYLATEGYLDARPPLTADQRRQRLIERLARHIEPERIHRQIDWLEANLPVESPPQ